MQFTIGAQTFTHPTAAAGQYALACAAGAPLRDLAVHHIPGVVGSYTVDKGAESQPVTARVKYVAATLATVLATIEGHLTTWASALVTIAPPSTTSFTRCQLTAARLSDPHPVDALVAVDVDLVFVSYSPKVPA